jgi:hypothetical protein
VTRLLTGAGVLALVGLLIWLYGDARYQAGRMAERAAWQAKAVQTTIDDLAARAKLDSARAAATQESAHDLEARMADALARAADRSVRLRDAAPAGGVEPDLSRSAGAAGAADGAGESAVLAADDDRACAEAVTKAQGWQDWWRQTVAATP